MSTILGVAATALAALAGYYKLRDHVGPPEPMPGSLRLPIAIIMAVAHFFMSMVDVYEGYRPSTRPQARTPNPAPSSTPTPRKRAVWGLNLASDCEA